MFYRQGKWRSQRWLIFGWEGKHDSSRNRTSRSSVQSLVPTQFFSVKLKNLWSDQHLKKVGAFSLKYFPYERVLLIITDISKIEIWLKFPLVYQTSFILFQLCFLITTPWNSDSTPPQSLASITHFPRITIDPHTYSPLSHEVHVQLILTKFICKMRLNVVFLFKALHFLDNNGWTG